MTDPVVDHDSAQSSSTSEKLASAPRLNSTCLLPPVIVHFQPPAYGTDFNSATPAYIAFNDSCCQPKNYAAAADSTAACASSASSNPVAALPVTLQYSIHRVPLSMKQELRPIFTELNSGTFAASASTAASNTPSTANSADSSTNTTAATSTSATASTSTAADFKSLPILAIPTFQKASLSLVHVSPEVEKEKNRLLESFYAWSKRVCMRLRAGGVWADFVDPCTGYPSIGAHGSSIYSEVDSAQILLAYRMEQVGNCSMIDHPQWHLAHYPATLLTVATVEQIQHAIAQTQEELKITTQQLTEPQ